MFSKSHSSEFAERCSHRLHKSCKRQKRKYLSKQVLFSHPFVFDECWSESLHTTVCTALPLTCSEHHSFSMWIYKIWVMMWSILYLWKCGFRVRTTQCFWYLISCLCCNIVPWYIEKTGLNIWSKTVPLLCHISLDVLNLKITDQ